MKHVLPLLATEAVEVAQRRRLAITVKELFMLGKA
jgi:hypothetical protein